MEGDAEEPQSGILLPFAVYGALLAAAIVVFAIAYRVGTAVDRALNPVHVTKFVSRTSLPPIVKTPVAGVGTPLRGNVGQFFGVDDYPVEALRRNEQGRTVARLTIAPSGTVSSCVVRTSSGSAALDAATCRIALTRVRFQPARDGTGNPIASSFTLPVRWVLPQETPQQSQQPVKTPSKDFPIVPGLIALAEGYVVARALTRGELAKTRSGQVTSRSSSPGRYWGFVGLHAFIALGAIVTTVEKLATR